MGKRILLVDADSSKGFPNLALMKLSSWYKQLGYDIELIKGIPTTAPLEQYDKVFISCIFFQNRDVVLDYAAQFDIPVDVGGSGIDYENKLLGPIEHIMPDYDLYDLDFSIGFTSRGCIRKCGFCIVAEKEGYIKDNASISEFLNPEYKKIVLLDNNFLASPKWKENIEYIINNRLKVNFNSGFDIRLITSENAELIKQTMCYDWKFKKRKLAFAFDSIHHHAQVIQGINTLRDAGVVLNPNNSMFYVLVGYDSTPTQDLERIRILTELNVSPYVMRYNKALGDNRILLHMARWVNRKYYQHVKFCDYDYSDSQRSYKATFRNERE